MEKTIIYTKNGCPYCAAAMKDMRERGEEFDERNCSENRSYVDDVVRISGGRVVPLIVRGNAHQVGFGGG